MAEGEIALQLQSCLHMDACNVELLLPLSIVFMGRLQLLEHVLVAFWCLCCGFILDSGHSLFYTFCCTTTSTDTEASPLSGADIRTVNMIALTSGVLHTKFWIVDKKHVYIGSANMDWRSLTQVHTQ